MHVTDHHQFLSFLEGFNILLIYSIYFTPIFSLLMWRVKSLANFKFKIVIN